MSAKVTWVVQTQHGTLACTRCDETCYSDKPLNGVSRRQVRECFEEDHSQCPEVPGKQRKSAAQYERERIANDRKEEIENAVRQALAEERLRCLIPRLIEIQKFTRHSWDPKAAIVEVELTSSGARILKVGYVEVERPRLIRGGKR